LVNDYLEWLRKSAGTNWEVVHHEILPEKTPIFKKTPHNLHFAVKDLIDSTGIESLYCHQVDAIENALQKRNVALSTSTSSGKTLCYQIPALDQLVREPDSHVLMLFPLKALERDQLDSFLNLSEKTGISAAIYDGDTLNPSGNGSDLGLPMFLSPIQICFTLVCWLFMTYGGASSGNFP